MNQQFCFLTFFYQIFKAEFIAGTFLIMSAFLFIQQIHAQLDPTFGTNGVATANTGVDNVPMTSGVLPDGKIMVVSANECCYGPYRYFFVRFNADGTLDSTYGTNGIIQVTVPFTFPFPSSGIIYDAAIQTDGKIILVGNDDGFRTITVRYNQNGTLDTGFANGGVHIQDFASGAESARMVTVLPDGKILISGCNNFGNNRLYLLRYNSNGSLDTSFGTNGSGFILHPTINVNQSEPSELLAMQSSGKIIVGLNVGGAGKIRRFNNAGTIDNSFTEINFTTVNFSGALAAELQPDDKILTASAITKTETLERIHHDILISRYNPDGSVDTNFGNGGQVSFDISGSLNDAPMEIKAMPDGQILVTVNTYVTDNRSLFRNWTLAFAKLSPGGAVNGKFLAAAGDDNVDRSHSTIAPDGKILTSFRLINGRILLVRALGVPLIDHKLRGIPFNLTNGTPFTDPTVYRPSDRRWYIYLQTSGVSFGLSDDILVPSDFIKNFQTELAVFRPSEGMWYIAREYENAATNFLTFRWGTAGDIPLPADFNGDGKSDIAVFRPSNGTWYIYYIADNSYTIQQFGLNGDKPAQGDFDGDGKYDIAVFRPSDGNWYIQRSSDGGYTILHFGLDGDVPVQEDYDGDGKTDIAVYRPSTGVWYRLNSSDGSFLAIQWGLAGDIPVPGDYDGDTKTNIAVWRPSNGGWYSLNPNNTTMIDYYLGSPTDIPLSGKF